MWISELSQRTDIPIDTIKHYVRVGVLPRGEPIGPQRMEYDESHVMRLRLVRALTDIGGLSLDRVRRVFTAVDTSQDSLRSAVGVAHLQLSAAMVERAEPTPESLEVVDRLIARQGWDIEAASTHRSALAVAIDTLVAVRSEAVRTSRTLEELLDTYARHLSEIAETELMHVDTSSREAAITSVLVGSVLYEPLLLVVRRLAQQHASRTWWIEKGWPTVPDIDEGPLLA